MTFVTRLLEIDAVPQHLPSEVEKLLRPFLTETPPNLQMKAGELHDADHVQSHTAYYVALRYPAASAESQTAADAFLQTLAERCRNMKLPCMEVRRDHPEFESLISEMGW